MKMIKALRNLALALMVGSFFISPPPATAYGECEESIVCESHGGGCYEEGEVCWVHSCNDGYCSSGCTDEDGNSGPGICGDAD